MNKVVLASVLLLAIFVPPTAPAYADPAGPASPQTLEWLEPSGLGIVDLVGRVPEDRLVGATLSWQIGGGILQYESGTRAGTTVTIRAKVFPRWIIADLQPPLPPIYVTMFNCLGQLPFSDGLGAAVPASTVRVWEGVEGTPSYNNLTDDMYLFRYIPAGQRWPDFNTRSYSRYMETESTLPFQGGAAVLPANRGCRLWVGGFHGNIYPMTAEFTIQVPPLVKVSVVGQEDLIFHSYIGSGDVGDLAPLMGQMQGRFGDRSETAALASIPADADYVLALVPPTPADGWTWPPVVNPQVNNIAQPSSGTYRFTDAGGSALSVDHTAFIGLPLRGQWQDADQGGAQYLNYLGRVEKMAGPAYVLPPGVPYDQCMTQGNCSDTLLDTIYNTAITVKLTYLKVERDSPNLVEVPVRAVGPDWGVVSQAAAVAAAEIPEAIEPRAYLPLVWSLLPLPPDNPAGCPCGWFDTDGRMVDFVPPQ